MNPKKSSFALVELLLTIAVLAILFASVAPAMAQAGINTYQVPRTIVVTPPVTESGSDVGIFTNNPIDLHNFIGIGKFDILLVTNVGGGSLTATLETSPDLTNWTAVANYSKATSTAVNYTNTYYGGSLKSTNTYLLPGVITTPTASTSGFATTYLSPAPFTNTGAITITAAGGFEIGVNVTDSARYWQIFYTPGGTVTNYSVSAIFTGIRATEVK